MTGLSPCFRRSSRDFGNISATGESSTEQTLSSEYPCIHAGYRVITKSLFYLPIRCRLFRPIKLPKCPPSFSSPLFSPLGVEAAVAGGAASDLASLPFDLPRSLSLPPLACPLLDAPPSLRPDPPLSSRRAFLGDFEPLCAPILLPDASAPPSSSESTAASTAFRFDPVPINPSLAAWIFSPRLRTT